MHSSVESTPFLWLDRPPGAFQAPWWHRKPWYVADLTNYKVCIRKEGQSWSSVTLVNAECIKFSCIAFQFWVYSVSLTRQASRRLLILGFDDMMTQETLVSRSKYSAIVVCAFKHTWHIWPTCLIKENYFTWISSRKVIDWMKQMKRNHDSLPLVSNISIYRMPTLSMCISHPTQITFWFGLIYWKHVDSVIGALFRSSMYGLRKSELWLKARHVIHKCTYSPDRHVIAQRANCYSAQNTALAFFQ